MLCVVVEVFICGDEAQQYSHSMAQKVRTVKASVAFLRLYYLEK